jgi:dethiobiotin synthetase/adenosylmethionine--8-amino-7-oxononanoate aminotransferase
MVANKALDEYRRMDSEGGWEGFKNSWRMDSASQPPASISINNSSPSAGIYSFFPPTLLDRLSHHPRLTGTFALGTVLVLKVRSEGSGYTSTASASIQARLLTLMDADGCGIHSRVLGNVIYFMTSLTTSTEQVTRLGEMIVKALDMD